MRKAIIILALIGATLTGYGQALPAGSVIFGQQSWLAPDGSVWVGKDGNGYKRLLVTTGGAFAQDIESTVTVTGTGSLHVPTPTSNGHAANKKYVDDAVAGVGVPTLQQVTDAGRTTNNQIGVKSGTPDFTTDGPTTFFGYGGITNINASGFGITGFENFPESPTPAPYSFSLNPNSFDLSATGPDQGNARLYIGNLGLTLRNKITYPITGGDLLNDYSISKTQNRFDELIQITDNVLPGASQVFMQRALYHDLGIAGFNMEYVNSSNDHSAVGISASADSAMITFYAIDSSPIWQVGRRTGSDNFIIKSISGDVVFEDSNTNPLIIIGRDGIEVLNPATGIILRSPNNSRWRITIDNTGNIQTTAL